MTELQFYQASHDRQFAQLRLAWLKGLLVLYDGGRGFRELPGSIDEGTMSNAQVWLALAVYTRLFADDRLTAATVARLDDYMMRTYTERPNANFYAWGMNAAAQSCEQHRMTSFVVSSASRPARISMASVRILTLPKTVVLTLKGWLQRSWC